MKKPKTIEELLALWDGPKALSEDLGVPYVNAQAMKLRKSVAITHWPQLIAAAARKGFQITTDDLLAMRTRQKAPSAAENGEVAA